MIPDGCALGSVAGTSVGESVVGIVGAGRVSVAGAAVDSLGFGIVFAGNAPETNVRRGIGSVLRENNPVPLKNSEPKWISAGTRIKINCALSEEQQASNGLC